MDTSGPAWSIVGIEHADLRKLNKKNALFWFATVSTHMKQNDEKT